MPCSPSTLSVALPRAPSSPELLSVAVDPPRHRLQVVLHEPDGRFRGLYAHAWRPSRRRLLIGRPPEQFEDQGQPGHEAWPLTNIAQEQPAGALLDLADPQAERVQGVRRGLLEADAYRLLCAGLPIRRLDTAETDECLREPGGLR